MRLNNLRQRYLELTNEILPKLAQHRRFPVQRITAFSEFCLIICSSVVGMRFSIANGGLPINSSPKLS